MYKSGKDDKLAKMINQINTNISQVSNNKLTKQK